MICTALTWSAVPKYSGILENFSMSELIKGVKTSAPDPNLFTGHERWGIAENSKDRELESPIGTADIVGSIRESSMWVAFECRAGTVD